MYVVVTDVGCMVVVSLNEKGFGNDFESGEIHFVGETVVASYLSQWEIDVVRYGEEVGMKNPRIGTVASGH